MLRVLAAAFLLSACAGRRGPAEAPPAAPEDLPRFVEVSTGVTRSGQPTPEGLEQLKARGVKTVLNLRLITPKQERRGAERLGLDLAEVGMDGFLSPTYTQLDRALAVLEDPARRPVHVHCKQGRDRTGVLVAAYRTSVEGWDIPKAAAEARSIGCCPRLFKDLEKYLAGYQKHRAKKR